jgi:tetratricopeptide (TPR) repeat protein
MQVPANSDFYPILGLHATRSRFLDQSANELTALNSGNFPLAQLATPEPIDSEALGVYYEPDKAKRWARLFADLLTQPETAQLRKAVMRDAEFREMLVQIALVQRMLKNCEPLTLHRRGYLESLHAIAGSTLPFIDTPDMRAYWQQLGSHACLQNWPKDIQRWMRLYANIGLNHHQHTRDLAEALLYDEVDDPEPQIQYLIEASLTAYLKMGRYEEAHRFAKRAIEQFDDSTTFAFSLEVLFALLDVSADRPPYSRY